MMTRGDKLVIQALRKELKVLERRADKAKREEDEHMNIADELIAINKTFNEILRSKDKAPLTLKKLNMLRKRRDQTARIMNKDIMKLTEKTVNSRLDLEALKDHINMMEFRCR